ncbi:MAG TPA: MaoC/PaaZ C-terminal domain-containing protein [Alphaproteobacteria bacterium]
MLNRLEDYVVYFEDLAVGDRFVSPARTVTEADIAAFAGLSGDYNPLHTDAVAAGASAYGERIAHGLLVLAIASGLCSRTPVMKFMERSVLGLLGVECRWLKPTLIGDTVHVVLEVTATRATSKPGRGLVEMRRSAVNQRGETVMESDWTLLVRARGAA